MADTLFIVSESGKVYQVTLGNPSASTELPDTDPNAIAAKRKAAEGVLIADVHPESEQKAAAASGEKAFAIMGTFVNLPLIGDGGTTKY
ncbi:MAG: hypothetical protein ABJC13_23810 [Acidobacteriota bacterium]